MKEKSYMLALPGEQEPEGRMEVLRRLKNAPDFKVVTADTEDEGRLEITVEYKGNRYRALLYPTGFELPEFYRCQHLFPDVDIEVMERAESGLAVEMMFGEDALDSYHLQLKLIHAVLPDAVAVLDDSSEKILSGHWVCLLYTSVVFGWLLFRAPSMTYAIDLAKAMIRPSKGLWNAGLFANNKILFLAVLGILLCGPVQALFPRFRNHIFDEENVSYGDIAVMIVLLFLSTMVVVSSTYTAFIYFQF